MTTVAKLSAGVRSERTEISASQAAERLGLTAQAIGQWSAKPDAPVRREGARVFVRWPAFARWREAHLVEQAKREASTDGDFEQHRTRKMAAEASLAEITLAKEQGQLVSVDDYGEALGRVLDVCMARLRALPPRMGHHGPDVERDLEREIEDIVNNLHSWDGDALPDAESNET
ncbi:hypothetical protein [Gemmatimonas sp.]|uniref:hypothetical protein n=1 Tax=Gemmatimonas sp. TaxID=1962908 RepID=UPI003DA2052D